MVELFCARYKRDEQYAVAFVGETVCRKFRFPDFIPQLPKVPLTGAKVLSIYIQKNIVEGYNINHREGTVGSSEYVFLVETFASK